MVGYVFGFNGHIVVDMNPKQHLEVPHLTASIRLDSLQEILHGIAPSQVVHSRQGTGAAVRHQQQNMPFGLQAG